MPHLLYLAPGSIYGADDRTRRLHRMEQLLLPSFTIAFLPPPGGGGQAEPPGRFSDAVRASRDTVSRIDPSECDAIVVGAALDPEVESLNRAARVPLLAPGAPSLALATALGTRLSIIVVDQHNAGLAAAMVAQAAVRPSIASIRSIEMPVATILRDPRAAQSALRREAEAASRHDGADVIYLGAMTLGMLDPDELRRTVGVPVIDPLPVVLLAAQNVVLARGRGGPAPRPRF
jgi:Asp/Glu/hydantoin racemase